MRAILACGGTGGHIFPASALAGELMESAHQVMLITDVRGSRMVPEDVKVEVIPARGFFKKSLKDKLKAMASFIQGRMKAGRLIEAFEPDAVIGAGGYASFPVLRAARGKGIPYFLIEQNSIPGRVTRLAARDAKEVYFGIPPSKDSLPGWLRDKAVVTGNILRRSVIVEEETKGEEVLVLGGSGGARRLNHLGYELAKDMPEQGFILLAGKRDYAEMAARTKLSNLDLVEFTSHPEELYARARVAVSRAGAVTLSELLANGIPSILVPFPYAVDDHQTANARWARNAGAALFLPETELDMVGKVLKGLLIRDDLREKMSAAGRKLIGLDAASRIKTRIEECLAG